MVRLFIILVSLIRYIFDLAVYRINQYQKQKLCFLQNLIKRQKYIIFSKIKHVVIQVSYKKRILNFEEKQLPIKSRIN